MPKILAVIENQERKTKSEKSDSLPFLFFVLRFSSFILHPS